MISTNPENGARFLAQDGRVLMIIDGKMVADVPHEAAARMAKALAQVAKVAEENANALKVAGDVAILLRAGANIGLTNNPRINAEAAKRAQWDSDLRRYMPGGVKSNEQFGRPAVRVGAPKTKELSA